MTNRPKCGIYGPWNWVCTRDYSHLGWHCCIRAGVLCEWIIDPSTGAPMQAFENGEPVEVPR